MALSAAAYAEALEALLPPGPALASDPEDPLLDLLRGLALELARIDGRAEDLRDESIPSSTDEALLDWERVAGLPDPCAVIPTTVEDRRAALVARLAEEGTPTPSSIAAKVLALTGVSVQIEEVVQARCGIARCGDAVWGDGWPHAFFVRAGATTVVPLRCGMRLGALRSWGNPQIACIVNRLKPAHTFALITYET